MKRIGWQAGVVLSPCIMPVGMALLLDLGGMLTYLVNNGGFYGYKVRLGQLEGHIRAWNKQ